LTNNRRGLSLAIVLLLGMVFSRRDSYEREKSSLCSRASASQSHAENLNEGADGGLGERAA
jgi:hypothetical protein